MEYEYESEAMQVIHEEMQDMHRSGFLSDAEMRKFDKLCLLKKPKKAYKAEKTLKMEPAAASI
jgi:DNA-binding transcriptional regulator YiaG